MTIEGAGKVTTHVLARDQIGSGQRRDLRRERDAMDLQIGDKIIHRTFGLGEIIDIQERIINGAQTHCYVVQVNNMTIWVPADIPGQNSLRKPTSPEEFIKTMEILTTPHDHLEEDRLERKKHLMDLMKDGQLSSICRVVRDLSYYKHNAKLNDQEKSILEHAIDSLLTEWSRSMDIPLDEAQKSMESMLQTQTNL